MDKWSRESEDDGSTTWLCIVMWLMGSAVYLLYLLPDVWHALIWLGVLASILIRKNSGSVKSKAITALFIFGLMVSYVDPSDIDMTEGRLDFKVEESSEPVVIKLRRFVQEVMNKKSDEYRYAHHGGYNWLYDVETRVRVRNWLYAFFDHKVLGSMGEGESLAASSLWEIGNFADKFGGEGEKEGDKKVMTYGDDFAGTFTDASTKDASLYAQVFVVNKNEIYFTLYRKDKRVKNSDQVKYIVDIKTSKGQQTLTGMGFSDRIKLGPSSSLKLHNHWINDEIIGFSIRKSDGVDTLTRYSFKMRNYFGYKETYAKLK